MASATTLYPVEFTEVSVEEIVTKAMAEFKSVMTGEEHEKLIAEKQSAIKEAIRKQAENDAKLYRKVAPLVTKGAESAELEAAMSTILSGNEIKLIKDTFKFETYQIEVYTCSKPGPKSFVSFSRGGEQAFPNMTLDSASKIQGAIWFQWASIVIEIFMLALSAIGIRVSLNKLQMEKISKAVEGVIKSSAFQKALMAFKNAWSKGDNMGKARAIFDFMKDSFTANIFWTIMKSILSTMSVWDYIKAIASVSAMIVAAFFTGGAALIAKIALALKDAFTIGQKLWNLKALEMIKVD